MVQERESPKRREAKWQGRSTKRRGRKAPGPRRLAQLPWRQVRNPYRPIEVLTPEGLAAITETAYRILEEIGMDFMHPEALEILKNAGAEVTPGSERVRLDRGFVTEALAHVRAGISRSTRATPPTT